jgi:hypothetical protein
VLARQETGHDLLPGAWLGSLPVWILHFWAWLAGVLQYYPALIATAGLQNLDWTFVEFLI